jgi:glucose-1-phosphate cytidylyltransferase
MKVVLFCGGLGTRLRDYSDSIPKPLVPIGARPILWHVMKYYAHFGHKEFILCLGHKSEKIKEYFLNYNECVTNDFTMTNGGKTLELMQSDIHDWKITFVDTGLKSNIGQRLKIVQPYLQGDDYFLANYSDGLTDMALDQMIREFMSTNKIAAFVCAPPSQSFHVVSLGHDGKVDKFERVKDAGVLINGGFFIFRKDIFSYMEEGEELVLEPFQRLIEKDLLIGYKVSRFWCMDTFKEQQELTDLVNQGTAPWEVWRNTRKQTEVKGIDMGEGRKAEDLETSFGQGIAAGGRR